MLFNYVLTVPGSSFTQRFKVQAEILWVEILMSACLRAARTLSIMYTHHVTSKSCDACIYARVVLPTWTTADTRMGGGGQPPHLPWP